METDNNIGCEEKPIDSSSKEENKEISTDIGISDAVDPTRNDASEDCKINTEDSFNKLNESESEKIESEQESSSSKEDTLNAVNNSDKNCNEETETVKKDCEEGDGIVESTTKSPTPTENEKKDKLETVLNGDSEVNNDENKSNDEVERNSKESPKPNQCPDETQMDYDDDLDDFDPSLLCPEMSMDVDENSVITNNPANAANDQNPSPIPSEQLFPTYIDEINGVEITFNLKPDEEELRAKYYGPINPIQNTKIHCTACNVHLGSALDNQHRRFVHPMLKVLICKECYHFYTSGEFDKDEDGSELYCRWCGQGGQVLCCSRCEFVFCKRCIRNNFGRKKMLEIRDSDNWHCFRCNQSQISIQRASCYEFFEYVRREVARASATTDFLPEVWSVDHSNCCEAKKRVHNDEIKPQKRKKVNIDPDFDPLSELEPPKVQMKPLPDTPTPSLGGVILPKGVHILTNLLHDNVQYVQQVPSSQILFNPASFVNLSGFRAITPGPQAAQLVRRVPTNPIPGVQSRPRLSFIQNKVKISNSTPMKHEWFEKTVRAAARVNSHLSFTLTQLNKAQSQADSVEGLAVVHNKLQEILSSSINSLIQIRKNLRSEFITGIKTTRMPPKKKESFLEDDDVILVSATPSVQPSTSQNTFTLVNPLSIMNKATTMVPNTVVPVRKGYLKVKSVSELQNVPPECITIPDDPPPLVSTASALPNPWSSIVATITVNSGATPILDNLTTNAPPVQMTYKSQNNPLVNVQHKSAKEVQRMLRAYVKVDRVDLLEMQKKLASTKQL